jgi:hypothetical protein
MTRRDQTLRAWINRESKADNWVSNISHKGIHHKKSTGSKLRKAAREFSTLHIIQVLTTKPSTSPTEHQPDLFSGTAEPQLDAHLPLSEH